MRLLLPIILLFVLSACSSNLSKTTLYPYIDQVPSNSIKRVMIANVNLGIPSRHYLQSYEATLDYALQTYLQNNDFIVVSNKAFEQQWTMAKERYGALFDPSIGRNTAAHIKALKDSLDAVFASQANLDAVIFTDLIETPINYQLASQSYAEFNGIRQRIQLKGDDLKELSSTDLPRTVNALSLAISIFNRKQQLIFHSVGGIELSEALSVKNGQAEFTRRNDLLNDNKAIQQAIALALHPLIRMKKYPQ